VLRLFAFLRPDRRLVDQLSALETRVSELEAAQHPARLMEWVELREQLKRYLARITTVEQRIKQREEGTSPDPGSAVTAALLRSKFPHQNGG
jgi:BMFP domain-containing protein YqiC